MTRDVGSAAATAASVASEAPPLPPRASSDRAWMVWKRSTIGIGVVGTISRASENAFVSSADVRVLIAIVVRRWSTGDPSSSW